MGTVPQWLESEVASHGFMSRGMDLLKGAISNDASERKVDLGKGQTMSFWMRPLVLNDRLRAKQMIPNKDKDDVILQALALVVLKATDENGQRLFDNGDYVDLKKMPESVLLQIMEEVYKNDFEEEMIDTEAGETMDDKSKNSTRSSRKSTD